MAVFKDILSAKEATATVITLMDFPLEKTILKNIVRTQ